MNFLNERVLQENIIKKLESNEWNLIDINKGWIRDSHEEVININVLMDSLLLTSATA